VAGGDCLLETSLVEVLRGDVERLVQGQGVMLQGHLEELRTLITGVGDGPVATMPSEARDLVIMRGGEERFAAALLEPVLQTIRHEADLWSRTHGDVLRDVLADIKERFSSPVVALEPIFAAIDKGNEAILARLSHPQGVEALLKGFREENERFLERMEQQTPMVPLIEALQAQTDRLLRQQKEALDAGITRLLVGDGQAFPFEKIMQTLRDQSDRVVGQLSEGLALQPVLQILEGHLRELGENQFHTLHQALMAMTSSLTDGRLELEPVIAAVREEGARLSSRLVEQMSFTPILEALIEQGQRLVSAQTEVVEGALTRHFQESGLDAGKLAHQLEVHLDELRDTLSSQINPEPLMRMIREESRRLLESLPEGGVKEGILEGIEQSESRLLQRLSALVSPDRMVATVADAVDAVVGRHAVGLGDSLGRIEGQQARNVSLWQADLKQVRDDVGNDFAGRLRSELQQVREALHQGMEQVGNGLAGRLNSGLEEVRGRIVADVGGRLGEELEQQTGDLLTGMRAVLEEKADDMVSRMETAGSGAEVGLSRRVEEIMDGAQVMFSSLSQALVRQGDALEKVLTGLSGLGAQVDPKPALARMLAEIRELFGQQQGQFAEEVSSRLHAAQMEATAVGAIREEGERLLMAQGTALTQGFAEFLTRVNSAATPGEVAEVVRMQLTSFRGELGLRLQELSHGSSKAVTVVLETLGEEMRGRHAGMDVLLRRLLESQAVLADRPDWQPVLAEMRRDMEVWQGGQSERFAAMLTARLGDVATADVVVSALRGEGEKLLAVQSQVMQRGLDAILERIPSMAGIEDAVTAVDFLRSELAGLLASETHRLETLAARAATSMESVIVSARTQMTGIQDLGGEIRDLLDRQGRWFKETIAARLESSGMAARLVSAFKEESEILMEAQATRVDERLGALFADLEARFSSQDFVDVVRGETARLAEDFRRGLADVEVALSVANVDPVLRAMQEQTAHLQNNQQQELAPILEYMTQPVPATDWSPVREMVAGEIRRMLVSQSEVMQNISAGLVEINAGLAPDIQAMLTVLRGQVQSGLQAAVSQASASWSDMQAQSRRQTEARALEIQNTVIASVREQGAWLASEQKRILDEVVQTLARGEHSEVISLPAIQMALGEEFDRLAGILEQWFSSVVERIEATQGREVDLQVVVDAIRGEGLRLQEELHQHVSPQPVVDAIMAETNRLFMGHGEELGRKLEAILSSRAGLGVAATVGMEEEGDAGETMVDVVEDTWQDAGVVEEEPGSGVALALEVVDVPAVPETVATEVGAGMVPQGNDGSVFRAWVSGMVKDNDETTVADVPGQPVADKVVYTQRSHSKPTLGGSPWLGRLPSVGKVPTPTVREAGGGVVEGEKDGTVAPVVVDNRIRVVYPVFEGQAGDDTGEEKIHGALVSARKDWVRLIQAMQGSRQGEIDGQSLSDLLASMGRFLTNHFGREAAFLVAMSDDLCSRLRWGAAVSDPVIARLLDQFGHQSNAFMTSHDRDALEVMALDHGFQKAAGTLKGQISAISNRSVRSRSAKVFRSGGIVTDVAAPKEDVPEPVPAKPLESVFAQEIKAESVPKPVVAYVSMGGAVQRFADALRVRTTPREDATAKGAKRPSDEVVEQRASKKTEPAFSSVSKPVPVATRTVVGGSPFRKVEEVIEPKVEGSPITGKESQTRRLPEVSKALPENLAVPTSKTEMENRFFSAFLDRRREGQE
ncbi:MAG TPA: apolipoprotein A1/A4/E family protein, partial [Magnetococcales bacterium]|nr:apolipoprotein A1/A4/E family protein [Magnetococcales bacterium]